MRKLSLVASLVGVGLPVLAAAQPPPPPPPGGGYAAAEPAEPKMRFDVGLFAASPQGDLEDSNINTSPGLNLQFGYNFMPNLGLSAGLRYIAIQVDGGDDSVDFSNYDFDVGLRYTLPVSPTAKIFGEGLVVFSTLAAEAGGQEESESGVGFMIRAGGQVKVSGNISVGGALSYSSASIELEGVGDLDVDWASLEGFVSFGF